MRTSLPPSSSIRLLAVSLVALAVGLCPGVKQSIALAGPPPGALLLLLDNFNGNTPNTFDLNVDLGRQSGSLAPLTYSMAVGPGHYGHQLQNVNAPDQLLLADFPNSTSSLNSNFNGANSAGGLRISFDLDSVPTVYSGTPDNWGCINLGTSQANQLVNVNQGVPHFGILFRAAGTLQAFDGSTVVSPSPEPVYSMRPPGSTNHVELLVTDTDGNPFDGLGNTIIEVYVNGGALPVWSYTKAGGYADNYINLQGSFRAHFDNFRIEQLPANRVPVVTNPSFEADTFTAFPGYVSGNGPITGWNALGGHGVNPGTFGGPFTDNGTIPDGTKAAFLQEDGAMRQVVSGFTVGTTYQILFFENARNCCSGTAPSLEVQIGGNTIVAAHAVPPVGGSNRYREVSSDPFVATASSMELAFIKSNPQGGDTTLLIDHVRVTSDPCPRITLQPLSLVAALGDAVTFAVGAVGRLPLSYQWFFGNQARADQTNAVLNILVDSPDVAGDYHVVVANSCGAATSAVARLTVRDAAPGLFNTGVDDSKAALADGEIDPHYKIIANADSASPDAFVENSGAFPIVAGPWVPNNAGSKWIGPRPDTSAAAGGDYTYRLTVDLTGFDPASVEISGDWSTDNSGLDILINGESTGQANPTGFTAFTPFRITNGFLAGLNTLEFRLNNAGAGYTGLRVDRIRGLGTVLPPGTAPFIVTQPTNVAAFLGDPVVLSVRANGSAPLQYQWYFGADPLPGETGPTLSFRLEFPDQAGAYSVNISSAFGSIRSAAAIVTVVNAPEITRQPQSQFVAAGETVTFTVEAKGLEPLSYQWTKNGQNILGEVGTMLTLNNVAAADAATYAVTVTNIFGRVTSDGAVLTVGQPVPGLFNTGVDNSGVSVPSGSVDPHWSLVQSADPGFPGPDAFVLNDVGFPIPPWIANDERSKWIAPQANQSSGNLLGDYAYRTTFDLSGFDPGSVRITGEWATDNEGLDILINGASTGQRNTGQFVVWTPFTISSGFQAGLNTIEIRLNNAPTGVNPTGLRVQNLRALGAMVETNRPPVARIVTLALCSGVASNLIISPNGSNACVVLDGSLSTDPDNDPLTYAWLADLDGDGAKEPLGMGVLLTNCFALGEYEIMLAVNDGQQTDMETATVEVITACDAIEDVIMRVGEAAVTRKCKRPLVATLKAGCASFERGDYASGINQLRAFILKVRVEMMPQNAEEAAWAIRSTQAVLDALKCE